MTDAEKLAELKKWARSFGMLQSIELMLNKIEEFDNEKTD